MERSKRNLRDLFRLLANVIEYLADEKRHLKGALAQDRFGKPIHPRHPNVEKLCVTGAIMRFIDDEFKERVGTFTVVGEITRMLGLKRGKLIAWNDNNEHGYIVAKLTEVRDAIKKELDEIKAR